MADMNILLLGISKSQMILTIKVMLNSIALIKTNLIQVMLIVNTKNIKIL